jgi:hypothetical protein
VYFPRTIPEEKGDQRLSTLGLLIEIAEFCDYDVYETKRESTASLWNTLDVLKDAILGAYYCLSRDKISPMDNVPKELKAGWEFILWYAYSKASGDSERGDFLKIPRLVRLISSTGAAWGDGKQFTELTRITTLLRLAGAHASKKLDAPKKFLKGEGYFLEKYAGKKPIGGLYADDELALVVQNWTQKSDRIKKVYKDIPDSFTGLGPAGISATIAQFNIQTEQRIKNIEDAKQRRIPSLLVTSGRGRNQTKEIAKGGNLPEKLLSIDGGDSVRTIGRTLWSPEFTGITQNQFTDIVMRNTVSQLSRRDQILGFFDQQLTYFRDTPGQNASFLAYNAISGAVSQATQLYLEVIPEHRGNPTWDSVFPIPT